VRVVPYALSKVAVLRRCFAVVDLLLLGVLRGAAAGCPPSPRPDSPRCTSPWLLTSACALAPGLLCSAGRLGRRAGHPDAADPVLPQCCSSARSSRTDDGAGRPVAQLRDVHRWSFEALGHTVGRGTPLAVRRIRARRRCCHLRNTFSRPVWQDGRSAGCTRCSFLATCAVLARKCGRRAPGGLRDDG